MSQMAKNGDSKLKNKKDQLRESWVKTNISTKELSKGMSGEEVVYLKEMLQTINLPIGTTNIDKKFGVELEKTIKGIQRGYTFYESGRLDSKTFVAIDNLVNIKKNYSKQSKTVQQGYINSLNQLKLNISQVELEYFLNPGLVKSGADKQSSWFEWGFFIPAET